MINIFMFISIDTIISQFIEPTTFSLLYIIKESFINTLLIFVSLSTLIISNLYIDFLRKVKSFSTPLVNYSSKRIYSIFSSFLQGVSIMNPYHNEKEVNPIDSRFSPKLNFEDEIVIIIDTIGKVIYANQIAILEFNLTKNEILGESIFDLFAKHEFHSKTWYEEVIKNNKSKSVIKICGEMEKWFILKYYANYNYNGELDTITITGNDVTLVAGKDSLKDIYSERDYLTGLINQYGMYERIKSLSHVRKARAFFIGILKFTELTNYYGHELTNELLNEIVIELKSIIDSDCILSRYTESKFVILCTNSNNELDLIEKLNKFLNTNYNINGLDLQIEKKLGYADFPKDTDNVDDLVKQASIALKEAIDSNSKNALKFESYMMEKLKNNIEIAHKLKNALDKEKIEVYFQKAIDCKTNEIFIIEELSRWNDEDLGYISPENFFRIARETNQLERLDKYMIKKSIEAFLKVRKKEEYHNVKVTLNISPESLLNQDFYDYILEFVDMNNIKTKDIFIEISESTFMNNLDYCITMINKYKNQGFMIALDDFGTEYSSLSVLESVDFDIIKIDQHFIKNINKISNQEIIKMIRRLTNMTFREMVAEGVETKEQSELLASLGCSIQQGYYLHRPENLLAEKIRRF